MNFTEFSFWWTASLIGFPLLLARAGLRHAGLLTPTADRVGLLLLSLGLFFNASPQSFLILLAEIATNYYALQIIATSAARRRAAVAALVISVDLAILIYFKYLDFFLRDFIAIVGLGVNPADPVIAVGAVPPGLSFYTFQMIGMVVDTLRSPAATRIPLIAYANFVTFFPQIVAGPIERRRSLLPQVMAFRAALTSRRLRDGVRWVVLGLFMKLVLADNLAAFIRLNEVANAYVVILSVYLFGLRIYFDFAGYSLIALGLARIVGVRLTLNFRAPYSARSVQDFWHRWHITLSNWFRDYVYIPLGGGRKGRWAINILVVFLLSGLWHGAGWNFVAWGAYHGVLLVGYRAYITWVRPLSRSSAKTAGSAFAWLTTYVIAMFGWLFFMDGNWLRIQQKIAALVSADAYASGLLTTFLGQLGPLDVMVLAVVLVFAHVVLILEHCSYRRRNSYHLLLRDPAIVVMTVSLVFMTPRGSSPFIYFSF